jgi:hypothetical protein
MVMTVLLGAFGGFIVLWLMTWPGPSWIEKARPPEEGKHQ